jgi:Ca2+-binding RTX toxin-like protein
MSSARRSIRPTWMLAVIVAAASVGLTPAVASAAPGCHGRPATIVGTPRTDELRGTPGADVIVGRGGNDTIDARGGDDVVCSGPGRDYVEAGVGDDVLSGGSGRDSLLGEGGADEIRGDDAWDWIVGGAGDDTLRGGRGPSDLIQGGHGDDQIDGGPGTGDYAAFGDAAAGVTVDLAAGTATGDGADLLSGIEDVLGTSFDDHLTGDGRPNGLVGGPGNDTLSSGGGGALECDEPQAPNVAPAVLRCADLLVGDTGDDTLIGGTGLDVAQYWDSPAMTVDLANGTATGDGSDALSGIEGVWGSRNDDTLIGDAGDNLFLSDQGNDDVRGGAGTDIASFGDNVAFVSVDLVAGTATGGYLDGAGHWTYALSGIEDVWGSDGPDTMTGDGGANDLRGFGGRDTIAGGDGDDTLHGGDGTDTLDGGPGADACVDGETVTNCEA